MLVTKTITKASRRRLGALIKPYGALSELAETAGVHRTTIVRLVKHGEAINTIIEKLEKAIGEPLEIVKY